jgi:hypothetical protein
MALAPAFAFQSYVVVMLPLDSRFAKIKSEWANAQAFANVKTHAGVVSLYLRKWQLLLRARFTVSNLHTLQRWQLRDTTALRSYIAGRY